MTDQSNTSNDKQLSVQDIIREIEQKSKGGGYIYRGERERHEGEPYYGKVSSSLWREYQIENDGFDVELVQTELLVAAKRHTGAPHQHFGLDIISLLENGEESAEEVVDFEILTEIQHYGGKTNLIDFTADYFIALFFACDGQPNEDGRVILQEIDTIKDMIASPRNPRNRVIAQKSVFVRPSRGFIKPHEIVIVPAYLKQDILGHLRIYHGISTEAIYNDIHGFIKNQDIHGEAYTEFYKGFVSHSRAYEVTTSEEREQEYEKTIGHYTKAIKLKRDLAEAYNNRGVAYNNKGEFDAAIQDHTKAIELNLQHASVYYNRGNAYNNKGEFDAAIQDHTKAIELNPQYAEAYNNRGVAYNNKGEFDAAIQDHTKAIELNPQNASAYYNRGNTHRQKGEFDAAIQDYDKAIELNPQYASAYNNRGNTHRQKGEFDAAIQDYTKAIELKPDLTEVYYNRGNTYGSKGEFDAAIQDYDKAIELNPQDASAYNNRGNTYGSKGEFDAAIQDYDKAIELNPQDASAYNNRGNTYGSKGEFDAAIQDYTKAIELNPQYAEAYGNRGIAYGLTGHVDAALQDYSKAIALKPDFAEVYINRSVMWLYLREWEKAKADLSDVKRMGADISTLFHRNYGSVEGFEQRTRIQLPADIVALLTPQ